MQTPPHVCQLLSSALYMLSNYRYTDIEIHNISGLLQSLFNAFALRVQNSSLQLPVYPLQRNIVEPEWSTINRTLLFLSLNNVKVSGFFALGDCLVAYNGHCMESNFSVNAPQTIYRMETTTHRRIVAALDHTHVKNMENFTTIPTPQYQFLAVSSSISHTPPIQVKATKKTNVTETLYGFEEPSENIDCNFLTNLIKEGHNSVSHERVFTPTNDESFSDKQNAFSPSKFFSFNEDNSFDHEKTSCDLDFLSECSNSHITATPLDQYNDATQMRKRSAASLDGSPKVKRSLLVPLTSTPITSSPTTSTVTTTKLTNTETNSPITELKPLKLFEKFLKS
jgi:hypothetical protein